MGTFYKRVRSLQGPARGRIAMARRATTVPRRRPRPRLPMVAGRPSKQPSTRQDVTSDFVNYSRRIAALSRWRVDCAGDRKMLVVQSRKVMGLSTHHREVDSSSKCAAQALHANPTPGKNVAAPGLMRIVRPWLRMLRLR